MFAVKAKVGKFQIRTEVGRKCNSETRTKFDMTTNQLSIHQSTIGRNELYKIISCIRGRRDIFANQPRRLLYDELLNVSNNF